MAKKYNSTVISLEELVLDSNNPRFSYETNEKNNMDESEIIMNLVNNHNVKGLANRICNAKDLHAGTRIICVKINDEYVVKEGNRRITACKLLCDRSKIPSNVIDFPIADEETIANISQINVDVYFDFDALNLALYDIHINGVKNWSTLEKYNYINAQFEVHNKSLNENIKELSVFFGESESKIAQYLREFRLFTYTVDVVKDAHEELDLGTAPLRPLVERGIKYIYKLLGISLRGKTIDYIPKVGAENIYKQIILLVGEAFLINKGEHKLDSRKILKFADLEKIVNDDIVIPGLNILIEEYKNFTEKKEENENQNNTQEKNEPSSDNSANDEKKDSSENKNKENEESDNQQSKKGNNNQERKLPNPGIFLTKYVDFAYTNEHPIDLANYIVDSYDFNHNLIDKDNIIITATDTINSSRYLDSISSVKIVTVTYSFGTIKSDLRINFRNRPSSPITGEQKEYIIATFNSDLFALNNLHIISNLVNAMNIMYSNKELYQEFRSIWCTALRLLFEVPTQRIENITTLNKEVSLKFKNKIVLDNTKDSIKMIFTYFKSIVGKFRNKPFRLTENEKGFCDKVLKQFDIKASTFDNFFNINELENCYNLTNVSSHNTGDKLTDDQIKLICKYISFYILLVENILSDEL